MNPQYSTKQSSKTFFHFNLQASNEIDLPIIIKHMKILEYFSSVRLFQDRKNNLKSIIAFVLVEGRKKDGDK